MSILSRWRERLRTRTDLLKAARKRHEIKPTKQSRETLDKRKDQVAYAERVVERHGGDKPKIVNLKLSIANRFGAIGPVSWVTGHHTAGAKDQDDAHAEALFRSYHRAHDEKGWGGIGYHYGISRAGTLFLLRPVALKGAHVGGHNSANIGVVCNGTVGDMPTPEQARTFAWLLANGHELPASHRVDLRKAGVRGHNDWSGHETNACPGTHKTMYLSRGARR